MAGKSFNLSKGVFSFNGRKGNVVPDPTDYTPEMIGAAPAGFGLGTSCTIIDASAELSSITKNGWYQFGTENTATDKPFTVGELFVIKRTTDGYCTQIAFSEDSFIPEIVIRKQPYSLGGFTPWEWVNPPMLLGVEYRTIERINGKPKYKRLISVGAMPNTTYIDVPISSYDIDVLLPPRGYMVSAGATQAIPYEFSGANRVGVQCSRNTLSVITEMDMSSYTGYFILEYSKTID